MLLLKDWKLNLLEIGLIDSLEEVNEYESYSEYMDSLIDHEY